jgi:hypothetical protein
MPKVILIPGTTTIDRVMENEVVADLTEDDKKKIDLDLSCCEAIGERYCSFGMKPCQRFRIVLASSKSSTPRNAKGADRLLAGPSTIESPESAQGIWKSPPTVVFGRCPRFVEEPLIWLQQRIVPK